MKCYLSNIEYKALNKILKLSKTGLTLASFLLIVDYALFSQNLLNFKIVIRKLFIAIETTASTVIMTIVQDLFSNIRFCRKVKIPDKISYSQTLRFNISHTPK